MPRTAQTSRTHTSQMLVPGPATILTSPSGFPHHEHVRVELGGEAMAGSTAARWRGNRRAGSPAGAPRVPGAAGIARPAAAGTRRAPLGAHSASFTRARMHAARASHALTHPHMPILRPSHRSAPPPMRITCSPHCVMRSRMLFAHSLHPVAPPMMPLAHALHPAAPHRCWSRPRRISSHIHRCRSRPRRIGWCAIRRRSRPHRIASRTRSVSSDLLPRLRLSARAISRESRAAWPSRTKVIGPVEI